MGVVGGEGKGTWDRGWTNTNPMYITATDGYSNLSYLTRKAILNTQGSQK